MNHKRMVLTSFVLALIIVFVTISPVFAGTVSITGYCGSHPCRGTISASLGTLYSTATVQFSDYHYGYVGATAVAYYFYPGDPPGVVRSVSRSGSDPNDFYYSIKSPNVPFQPVEVGKGIFATETEGYSWSDYVFIYL